MTKGKTLFCCIIGTMLEWYDFAIFGIMSPVLAQLFFPHTNKSTAIMIAFALFAVSFVMRPLGGIFLSHIGDKYGRKKAIVLSVLLMTISTVSIGLLPIHMSGIRIILILLALRLLQGLSVGGETPGMIIYAGELAGKNHFFIYQGLLLLALNGGVLLGSISSNFFLSWHTPNAWRLPFLVSVLLGTLALYLRLKAVESPAFNKAQQQQQLLALPIKSVIQQRWKTIVWSALVLTAPAVCYWYAVIYYPSYIHQYYPNYSAYLPLDSVAVITMMVIGILVSICVYYKTYLKWVSAGLLGSVLFAVPLLMLASHNPNRYALLSLIIFSLLISSQVVLIQFMGIFLFATNMRYTGVASYYNLAAMVGGLLPLLAKFLVNTTGNVYLPALYISGLSLMSLLIVLYNWRYIQAKLNNSGGL